MTKNNRFLQRMGKVGRIADSLNPSRTVGQEVSAKRTEFSKTFRLDNGRYKVVHSVRPLHYSDGGQYKEIDLTLQERRDFYEVTRAPYKAKVFKDKIRVEVSLADGGFIGLELLEAGGNAVNLGAITITADQNTIVWENVFTDTDIIFVARTHDVEVFKRIRSENGTGHFLWSVEESGTGLKINTNIVGLDENNNALEITKKVEGEQVRGGMKTYTLEEEWTGRVGVLADERTRQKQWRAEDAAYPLLVDVTIGLDITHTNDDGRELYKSSYSNYWYPEPYSTYSVNIWGRTNVNWHGGLRFRSVNVPQGATITSATVTTVVQSVQGTPNLTMYGNDVDDAPGWGNTGNNKPHQVVKTTASVGYTPTGSGSYQSNVTSIVQEIVDRGGWSSGNDIRFALINQAVANNNRANVWDLKAANGSEATLDIEYEEGGATVVQDIIGSGIIPFAR